MKYCILKASSIVLFSVKNIYHIFIIHILQTSILHFKLYNIKTFLGSGRKNNVVLKS